MEAILLKIEELGKELFLNNNSLNTSSNITSISYGYKHVNNIQTDELCIVYTVKEKKPISELLPSEIISKTISIDNAIVKTDVKELYSIKLLACNPACGQVAGPSSAANRTYTRPLKGGLSITSTNTVTTVGTMGFIAVHTATNTLVGVTNNHVVIQDAYIACDRGNSSPYQNEYQPINNVYQNGESGIIPPPNYTIGQTLKYKPISNTATNSVDCAIFSLRQTDIDMTNPSTSVMQSGEVYTAALPFATTAEINSLLASNPMLYSSGRTTGPKGGAACPLRILSTFNTFSISYPLQGIPTPCTFTNVLSFVKPEFDPSLSTVCVNPIYGGDSGSALIADFGGVRKIIGLVFASGGDAFGNTFFGYACRIDVVAAQMGIQAWDGTNKGFVDESSIVHKTVLGLSCNETLQCSVSDPIYYQAGITNSLNNPCPIASNNFTTTWETTTAGESIYLPYVPTGTYSGTIDWGDGNTDVNDGSVTTHTYATAGTYTVIIIGTCDGWNFSGISILDRAKITSVVHWGQLQSTNGFGFIAMFQACINLDLSSVSDTLNLTNIINLTNMFVGCTSLTSINNINSWNTFGVLDMQNMFLGCTAFNQPLILSTSNVTNMRQMFYNCISFDSLLNFNTSAVTDMSNMFYNCTSFNKPVVFNTIAVTNMSNMFYNCTAFDSIVTLNTGVVPTNMNFMFTHCINFNQPLTFNTGQVTNMSFMFWNTPAFQQDISSWDISNVTNFTNFMGDKTPATWSQTNFNSLLCGWSLQTVNPNLTIDFGSAQFSNATGLACKNVLTSPPNNWIVNSGGGV